MRWNWQRVALAGIDGFAALSSIGGGYAVMVGAIKPGVSLTSGPFGWLISDYFVAGEILVLVTGGTALAALVAMVLSRTAGAGFSLAAGFVMMGWIAGEVVLIGLSHWLQLVYFTVGVVMVVLSAMVEPSELKAAARRMHFA